VTGTVLALSGFSSANANQRQTSGSETPSSVADTAVSVTLNSSTTYSKEEAATASNLAPGDCVTAGGSLDSTGAVTATNIRITSTGGKTCASGFGGFGGFGGPGGAGGRGAAPAGG
jgi:hypothetical protein